MIGISLTERHSYQFFFSQSILVSMFHIFDAGCTCVCTLEMTREIEDEVWNDTISAIPTIYRKELLFQPDSLYKTSSSCCCTIFASNKAIYLKLSGAIRDAEEQIKFLGMPNYFLEQRNCRQIYLHLLASNCVSIPHTVLQLISQLIGRLVWWDFDICLFPKRNKAMLGNYKARFVWRQIGW